MGLKRVAIYHFTDGSKKRPIVCQKQIDRLKDFANRPDWEVKEVFCDDSLRKSKHPGFEAFWENRKDFDVLVTKDFYHIQIHTKSCMEIMKALREESIQVYSLENGYFSFEEVPLNEHLRVATYFGRTKVYQHEMIGIQNDIFKHFIKEKTSWEIVDMYVDELPLRIDKEQIQLHELIRNRDKYDLILVKSLGSIHWRMAKFCSIREELQKDIFSLQDGFLKYCKEQGGKDL